MSEAKERNDESDLTPLLCCLAYVADRSLIWIYTTFGRGDKPCGKIQTWAREIRNRQIDVSIDKKAT